MTLLSLYAFLFNLIMVLTVIYLPLKWLIRKTDHTQGLPIVLWIGRIVKCFWLGWTYYYLYFILRNGMSPVVTILMMAFGTGGFVFAHYFWKAASEVEKLKSSCNK